MLAKHCVGFRLSCLQKPKPLAIVALVFRLSKGRAAMAGDKDQIERVVKKREQLRARRAEVDAAFTKLDQERKSIDQELAKVDIFFSVLSSVGVDTSRAETAPAAPTPAVVQHGSKKERVLAFAEALIRERGPQQSRDILEALDASGQGELIG